MFEEPPFGDHGYFTCNNPERNFSKAQKSFTWNNFIVADNLQLWNCISLK